MELLLTGIEGGAGIAPRKNSTGRSDPCAVLVALIYLLVVMLAADGFPTYGQRLSGRYLVWASVWRHCQGEYVHLGIAAKALLPEHKPFIHL